MKNVPLDFQLATARHILEAFRSGRKRMLVADEPGLGKTTVAAEVVRRVKSELADEVLADDGLYCVVYVCCNLQIARQNIATLSGDAELVDMGESRLSMQHFVYYRKKADLTAAGKDTLVLSLTPTTSFHITWGTGTAPERALMYACLTLLPEFADDERRRRLSGLFACYAPKQWPAVSERYFDRVRADDMEAYRDMITRAMRRALGQPTAEGEPTALERLIELCDSSAEPTENARRDKIIVGLRKMFAAISLDIIRPDLVIMDEFQKFSSLLGMGDGDVPQRMTEQNEVARKFLADSSLYILLLSATPYTPYTTLRELNDENCDRHYRDFHRLMDFLYVDSHGAEEFRRVWHDYSLALTRSNIGAQQQLMMKHDSAEEMLYRVMCRTERLNSGIISDDLPPVIDWLTPHDIVAYVQIQRLVDSCRRTGEKLYRAPVDYTKSAPFPLSFMDNYSLKESIARAWTKGAAKGLDTDCLLLDERAIASYRLKDYPNAILRTVIDRIFGPERRLPGVESMLWVPPSQPYYTQPENVFTRNKSFSKFLVFSSWGMVPRMLACLISYESERRLFRNSGMKYAKETSQLLVDNTGMRKKSMSKSLLTAVSPALADLYDPTEYHGRPLADIRRRVQTKARELLAEKGITGSTTKRTGSADLWRLLRALDDPQAKVAKIPERPEVFLADMAIGSPAACLYRIFKNLNDPAASAHAGEVAEALIGIFNTRVGIAAVRRNSRAGAYFRQVVDYCIQGNLQAVLDEFVHMIGIHRKPADIVHRLTESFIDHYPQPVNTRSTFDTGAKMTMHKHFAIDYGTGRQTDAGLNRSGEVRDAFNSPFRPFLLASTSVGQEGLDFHWYCRKVVHWNLPPTPQSLEQREGRVNRFKCLSVRRNIAALYRHTHSWEEMFARASADLKGTRSAMVPYWYLPLDHPLLRNLPLEKIERIVPMYPHSNETLRYRRLIDILFLYRLTLGQPRQEDLLTHLPPALISTARSSLLFDLSPFSRDSNCSQTPLSGIIT